MDRTDWHLGGSTERRSRCRTDFPDGELRTNARASRDISEAFMAFGDLDGVRILEAETVGAMRRAQFPDVAHGQA